MVCPIEGAVSVLSKGHFERVNIIVEVKEIPTPSFSLIASPIEEERQADIRLAVGGMSAIPIGFRESSLSGSSNVAAAPTAPNWCPLSGNDHPR